MEIVTLKEPDDVTINDNQKEVKDAAVIGVYDINLKVGDGFRFGIGVILAWLLFIFIIFLLFLLFSGFLKESLDLYIKNNFLIK